MNALTPLDPAIDVSVSVVNWNGAGWLRDCLASLEEVRGVRAEVIVVDNASTDESVEIVREHFKQAHLVVNPGNLGFARANNQAIRQGRGRYFFLLNNDTVLHPGSMESLVRFLDAHPRAGIAAGRLENRDGSVQFQYYPVTLPSLASVTADLFWLNRIWPRAHVGRGVLARRWDPATAVRMEQLPGACMMIRREVLQQIGLLDESYDFWYEDVDFSRRAGRAGWELWYVPEARIYHRGGASSGLQGGATRSLWRFRNLMRYAGRSFSPVRFLVLRLVLSAVLLSRLPLVVALGLWPDKEIRRAWHGAWRAYLKLLGEVISLREGPAQLECR
jgi:hypothetical protein